MTGSTSRIALLGLGAAARNIHLPAYARLDRVRVVAGCDPAAVAGGFPFPVYESLERMLEHHEVDVAVVATPTSFHYPIAHELISRGIHVLCEKPFAERLDEAIRLVEFARERNVGIAVNNEFRFMNCYRSARKLVGDPRFGDLRFVEMNQAFCAGADTEAGWRGQDPERTCKEFGTHVFDLSRYFFGSEPLRLRARMPRSAAKDGPDMLNLIDVEFPDDRWARITLNRVTRGDHRYLDIRLEGTEGCVQTAFGGHADLALGLNARTRRPYAHLDLAPGGQAHLWHGERRTKLASDPIDPFAHATRALMNDFLQSIAQGRPAVCSGSDNLRTFAMMRAAYDSATLDRDIDLTFLADLP